MRLDARLESIGEGCNIQPTAVRAKGQLGGIMIVQETKRKEETKLPSDGKEGK